MPGRPRMRRPVLWVIALATAALATPACSSPGPPNRSQAAGVTSASPSPGASSTAPPAREPTRLPVPATPAAAGAPGALIDAEPIAAPFESRAWHIVYHSRDVSGRDIAVTGTLLVPDHPAPGTPLITWGHPTTGTADQCAPSTRGTADLPLPEQLVRRGWAVVATDYEGLGTTALHPYLVGTSEGHAVLDAARAAPQVAGSGLGAAPPVAIWGFSQGGHAAAFAGQLAPAYAPEVAIVGVALAAPVSDVAGFARRAEGIPNQFGVLVTIIGGMAAAYPDVDPTQAFTPEVTDHLVELDRQCIGAINQYFDRPIAPMLRAGATSIAPIAARLNENQVGLAPVPVPVLVVQGAIDDIVDPVATNAMVTRYCARGMTVATEIVPDTGHGVMRDQPFLDWTAARLAGEAAPSSCPP